MNSSVVNGWDGRTGRVLCDGHLRLIEVLRVSIGQVRNISLRPPSSLCITTRIDERDIYHSSKSITPSNSMVCIGEEFVHEVSGSFSQLNFEVSEGGRIPRRIGFITVRKRDILRHNGKDRWYCISSTNKSCDVSGRICVDMRYEQRSSCITIRVVDYCDIDASESGEFYLLVTLQGSGRKDAQKLRLMTDKENEAMLVLDCNAIGSSVRPYVILSLWSDMPGGFNSCFHGQIRISLNENILKLKGESGGPQWYHLKPRMANDDSGELIGENGESPRCGEIRLRLLYVADHILPLKLYEPLQTSLLNSSNHQPFWATTAGLLQHLPSIDIGSLARSLMKIFVHAKLIRPLLRILCANDIVQCQDVNTLFRSQSLASKIIYEQMRFFGQHYLLISLKPVIDMIYADRKNCEVDPSKVKAGDSLESNKWNLITYGEIAFSRIVDSYRRCPLSLREMFLDLRELVLRYFPGREDVQRLALSSFIVMRFFAAGIMNPKLFAIKREQPDPTVARTLVLISKILQKISNCVVSENILTVKEPWLNPILERFTDDNHRTAMLKFLDRISLLDDPSISGEDMSVLREGFFIEHKTKEKRKILNKLINNKRRYVVLTEKEICWQKSKADDEPKGRIQLHEVNAIEAVQHEKNVFRISSPSCEIQLQAPNNSEMNEWIVQIKKQRKMQLNGAPKVNEVIENQKLDVERELECIHMTLYEHIDILKNWKTALENNEIHSSLIPRPIQNMLDDCENIEETKELFISTLQTVLDNTLIIENAHQEVINIFMNEVRSRKGVRELPIGDDNYLILNSRFNRALA